MKYIKPIIGTIALMSVVRWVCVSTPQIDFGANFQTLQFGTNISLILLWGLNSVVDDLIALTVEGGKNEAA